ncbi:MAG: hypothetical protein JWQ68_1341, partial [Cryobacterium sp.]|nr:hypothetical protein [Cryobacterium sp.]
MQKGPTPSGRPFLHGGAKGIRTPDLLIANETRYQLRHSPKLPMQTITRGGRVFDSLALPR